MSYLTKLEAPLLQLSPKDVFSLRDACAGVHIFGGIGSGKTSGSGRMLAGAYLRAGMGGLVTAVKPEEVTLWQRYAAEHGRSNSLILFDEHEGFNFLAYEFGRQGIDGVGTVTECLMKILEAAKRASPTAGTVAINPSGKTRRGRFCATRSCPSTWPMEPFPFRTFWSSFTPRQQTREWLMKKAGKASPSCIRR